MVAYMHKLSTQQVQAGLTAEAPVSDVQQDYETRDKGRSKSTSFWRRPWWGSDRKSMTEGAGGGGGEPKDRKFGREKPREGRGRRRRANIEMDKELIGTYVTSESDDGGVIFSAWDYGGQDVFYTLHPLFLTRYGVYLVVFNMEDLSSTAPIAHQTRCLAYLRFWLFSIAVHATGVDGTVAPVVIVGTHKDKVSDWHEHAAISSLIHDTFAMSPIWQNVQPCREGADKDLPVLLWFYPVNNTRGHDDPILRALVQTIEIVTRAEEYLNKKVPFAWLKLIDSIGRIKSAQPILSLNDLQKLAVSCGLPTRFRLREEVRLVLQYLNQLGIVMWFDEPALDDLVILDPMWLIVAATKIISKLDMHFTPEMEQARKLFVPWRLLTTEAVLDASILQVLWAAYPEATRQSLIHLLCRYGLAVPLLNGQYLVPALLRPSLAPTDELRAPVLVCHIAFSVSLLNDGQPDTAAVRARKQLREGFLPTGLFVRLLGKSVGWSQSTTMQGTSFPSRLSRTRAVLAFGGDVFMMHEDADHNAVVVSMEHRNPTLVLERIEAMLSEVISECFPNLEYDVMLPLPDFDGNDEDLTLLSLSAVRASIVAKASLWAGARQMTHHHLLATFEPWLPPTGLRPAYDIFVSYRWNLIDSDFAAKLFDCFRYLSVGAERRRVEVFLDRERLEMGRRFDLDFLTALSCSTIACPLVSPASLRPMVRLNPASPVDNVLLEWTVMLELHAAQRLSLILPVLLGEVEETPGEPVRIKSVFETTVAGRSLSVSSEVSDLDDVPEAEEGEAVRVFSELPEIVVSSVVARATEFLSSAGIEPSPKMASRTVKQTVQEMCQHLGIACDAELSKCPPGSVLSLTGLHARCVGLVFDRLQAMSDDAIAGGATTKPSTAPKPVMLTVVTLTDEVRKKLRAGKEWTVERFLKENQLESFGPAFQENGYLAIEVLFEMTEEELYDCGMKKGHVRMFNLGLNKLVELLGQN
eukprot:c18549_g1_i1.p1 GENE.c18549_g1_i1~~c18549_g1_i1.p1  ORF type:complete len:999 (+),score=240.54 c18549_g1_i1:66-2999(+)